MATFGVHHVQLSVRNGSYYVHKLVSNVTFNLFAIRRDVHRTDWVLKSGSSVFVVSEHRDETLHDPASRARAEPEEARGRDRLESAAEHRCCDPTPQRIASASELKPVSDLIPPEDVKAASELHGLGYISPPFSTHTLDFSLPKNELGNIDTVCNVAFEVCDVEATVAQAKNGGAKVLCKPTIIKDHNGYVTVAAVKSCVGNVVHTLINTKHYQGIFLPGFSEISKMELSKAKATQSHSHFQCNKDRDLNLMDVEFSTSKLPEMDPTVTHFDHVTFAIPTGTSNEVLDWYERCFAMRRFWLDRNEDKREGFLVRGRNVGLRMKAMEYWRCAETGLVFSDGRNKKAEKEPVMMFVFAEALPDQGANQVETFIEQHGGPGIQHIGLYAPNIEYTVSHFQRNGLDFMVPPSAYYTKVGKLQEMMLVGRDPAVLQKLGILLDAEYVHDEENEADGKNVRYLMQVFTRPIFDRDTFFLEVIQRHGASGFGAGNIKALWRSVEAYMAEKDSVNETSQITSDTLTY